jgi:tetratricopeptide (TPR) repeat protein
MLPQEGQRLFRLLGKMPKHRPSTAIAVAAGLFAACFGIEAHGQSDCTEAHSIAAIASTHPTAANYIELGNWFGNQRQFGCATEAFRAALKLDPRSPIALDGLSKALLADDDSADVVALLATAHLNEALTVDLGRAMVKQGLFEDAAKTLSQGLKKYPASQALTNELGGLYILENDGDRAVQVAESTAHAHPADLEAQRFYLRTLVTKNDEAKAIPLARRLLAIAPSDADLLYLAGTIERMAGDYPAARRLLDKSLAIYPGNANCHYNLGLTLAQLGDHAAAKAELEKALELGETDHALHFELAIELRNLGQAKEAKAEIELYQAGKEATAKRTLAAVKSTAADQALAAGDPRGAAALFREACDAQPQDPMLAFKLATTLDQTGDLSAERAALERAVDIDPSFALAQAQLGYVESQLGNTAAAEQRFRQAVRAAPEYAEGWVSLATTLAMESRFPEAREAVATAIKLDPKNANAIELSRNLAATAAQPRP